ncbi:MAG: hypothetical protein HQK87_04475 [Nitrospinae bacterium]|nr:hypothetical protein [Nitrospinota bacterium]
MLTPEGRATVQGFLTRLNYLWMVMLGLVGVYVAITLLLVRGGMNLLGVDPSLFPLFTATLALIGAGEILAMLWLDRRFATPASLRRFIAGKGATAINIEIPDPRTLDDDRAALALLPHYFQAAVIRWSLIEVVGVYGLALAFLTGQTLMPSVFYAMTVALLIWRRANIGEVEGLLATVRTMDDGQ